MKRTSAIVISTIVLAGCSTGSGYRTAATSITPAHGQTAQQQAADAAACEEIAKDQTNRGTETAKGAGVGAAGGALAGAAAGAAIGAATGGNVGSISRIFFRMPFSIL